MIMKADKSRVLHVYLHITKIKAFFSNVSITISVIIFVRCMSIIRKVAFNENYIRNALFPRRMHAISRLRQSFELNRDNKIYFFHL